MDNKKDMNILEKCSFQKMPACNIDLFNRPRWRNANEKNMGANIESGTE